MKNIDRHVAEPGRKTRSPVQLRARNRIVHESDRITATEYRDALERGDASASITLQIHLPFCAVRCLSCRSNVTITHEPAVIDRYLDSLEREIALVVDRIGQGQRVGRLHVGGGSPNYLSDLQLVRLMSILEDAFTLDPDTDMSLDANARHTSATQLSLLRGLGFTRITFPLGDLDPMVQLSIGRIQSFEMLREVYDTVRSAGFETISTELLYGLPGQTTQSMRRTVKLLALLAPDRIGCQAFQRQPDRFPHQLGLDASHVPSVADKLALLNVVVDELGDDDYAWIGMDCFTRREDPFAQAQQQLRLKHDWLGYTLHDNDRMFGFGTNSVSEVGQVCVQNHLEIDNWNGALSAGLLPIRDGIRLSTAEQRYRGVLTDLMCNLESNDCTPLFENEDDSRRIGDYRDRGLLEIDGSRIAITPQGRYLLPQIWSESVPEQLRWRYPH